MHAEDLPQQISSHPPEETQPRTETHDSNKGKLSDSGYRVEVD